MGRRTHPALYRLTVRNPKKPYRRKIAAIFVQWPLLIIPTTPSAVQAHASGEPVWIGDLIAIVLTRRFWRKWKSTVDSIVAGNIYRNDPGCWSTRPGHYRGHQRHSVRSVEHRNASLSTHVPVAADSIPITVPASGLPMLMLDLNRRGRDVQALLVQAIWRTWFPSALGRFWRLRATPRVGRVGLWVDRTQDKGRGHEDKIAAIGIRIRRWVSFHGVAINVNPDLTEFDRIVPCGIADARFGVTSLADLGVAATMDDLDRAFKRAFPQTIDRLLPQASY